MNRPATQADVVHARGRGLGRRAVRAVGALAGDRERRPLLLALVAAAASALAFARVAEDYLTNDPLARWDLELARWLAGVRDPTGVDVFRVVTFLGSPAVVVALAAVACVALYRRRHLLDALLLPLALGSAELLNVVLKLAFHRPRPEVAFVHLDTYSFPSGHAMVSAAGYGALAYLAARAAAGGRRRAAIVAGAVAWVALVCVSRVYLGVHYLSDVLAGAAGGAFALSASIAVVAAFGAAAGRRLEGSRLDRLARRLTRS
jgi:membrane-associated phospholipid phosphatase